MFNEARITCLHPISVVNPRYRSQKTTYDKRDAQGREDYKLLVPCGHCILCRRRRSSSWHFRLYHEAANTPSFNIGNKSYLNIWFVTFTFSDEFLPDKHSDTLRSDIAPYIRAWRDNWRKRFGISPRYFCVTDIGGEKGRLHLHLMIFNPTTKDGKRISVSSVFELNSDDPHKQLEWRYGFCTYCALVRGIEAIHYISGYINNQNALKTQKKHGKPLHPDALRHVPVTFCSNGIGAAFITSEEFQRLKRSKRALTRLGQYTYAVPRYYRIKYFDPIRISTHWVEGPRFAGTPHDLSHFRWRSHEICVPPDVQLTQSNAAHVRKMRDELTASPLRLVCGSKSFYTLDQLNRFVAENNKLYGKPKEYEFKSNNFSYELPAVVIQQSLFNQNPLMYV